MLIQSRKPVEVATLFLQPSEMKFVQFLPIKFPSNNVKDVRLPENLKYLEELIQAVYLDHDIEDDDYLYVTVKHLYCTPYNLGNRNGWHIDGFQSNDIQFVWCDAAPTQYAIQDFHIEDDCSQSMVQMSDQANEDTVWTSEPNVLYKIDTSNVHRVSTVPYEGMRTFVRISVSKEKYNLIGNAHNYLFDYNWEMFSRNLNRNHTSRCVDFKR